MSGGSIDPQTLRRLREHAGFDEPAAASAERVAVAVLLDESALGARRAALGDFLAVLSALNEEVNVSPPRLERGGEEGISRMAVHCVTQTICLLRRDADLTSAGDAAALARERAVVAEIAWSGVLAGDVLDLREHIEATLTADPRRA